MKTKNSIDIVALYISTPTGLKKKESIVVDKLGIEDDKFYGKSQNRAVLITSTYAYSLIRKNNIPISFGELGENILVDFDIHKLKKDDTLHIGDVLLQITQPCTICDHLCKIDKKVPKLLKEDRGIFAKVIKAGTIAKSMKGKLTSHFAN